MNVNQCLTCYGKVEEGDYHAKCSKELFGNTSAPTLEIGPEDIEEMAREIVHRRLTVPGVQKKLSLALEQNQNHGRLTIVGALGGTHILKPPTSEYPEMPEVENLSMHLANICGIRTAFHGLIRMKGGSFAYITRRFDRIGKTKKLAVEDLCQLSELPSENKYKSTSEKAGKVIKKYSSNPGDDALKFFEIIIFSFLIGNSDMHLKNFSLIDNGKGLIAMSPVYDLLATDLLIEDKEELALQVNGKKSNIKIEDLRALGKNLQIPEKVIKNCISNMTSKLSTLKDEIQKSILSSEKKQQYSALLTLRCDRLLAANDKA